jgi:alanine racemase
LTSLPHRWTVAEIDLAAVRHNVGVVHRLVAPAAVWAVVKANGYGHGAVSVARAALAGGASGLCVALVQEGLELRAAGIDAPVLVLSQQPVEQVAAALGADLDMTVYTAEFIDAVARAAVAAKRVATVHLKVDTGMQRVGCPPSDAAARAQQIADHPAFRLGSMFTHLAVADSPADHFTDEQLERFDHAVESVTALGIDPPLLHAANSAGALAHPAARRDVVRLGIAMYGLLPGRDIAAMCAELRPALRLVARVGHVKRVAAGSRVSYGLRHTFADDTTVATIPIGYADGIPRRLAAAGGEVLVGGRRRPIVGVVTMDQLMVDCGDVEPGVEVSVGDEVVLIGDQAATDGTMNRITADDWAELLGTIGYEIVCGISARVPRIDID